MEDQKKIVLRMLRESGSEGITSWEAIKTHGITRLADRIFKLRKMGYTIRTENHISGRKRFAKYILEESKVSKFKNFISKLLKKS